MFQFIPDVDSAIFDAFVRNHPSKSHFMQSSAWGELSEVEKGLRAHRVGLADESGSLVAAALLLERKPPMFPPYLYAPRGFVVDFHDFALLEAMTREVAAFARSRGAMFFKIDPDIEHWQIDGKGNPVPGGYDNTDVFNALLRFGFKHQGFNKGFEGRQPRYTFRLDLTRSDDEIDKAIVGNVMKNVKKSSRYACEVVKGASSDVAELHRLITITSERDDFVGYGLSYYQNFYDILAAHDMATLYLGKVDPARTVSLLRAELDALLEKRKMLKKPGPLHESELSEQRLLREIEQFESYARTYPNGATISAHLVVRYGDKAWAVHAGSDRLMSETFINNRVYYEKIHDVKRMGARLLDQFGTVGNPEESTLSSLHDFKRQFGGNYVEFLGEFDYILKPIGYFAYVHLLPLYRKARISLKMALRGKKTRNSEN